MSNPAKFLNTIEKIGLGFFSIVFILAVFLLFNEDKLFKRETFGDKIAVAFIKEIKNDVQIKGEKDINWREPKVGENLYQSDQVLTQDGSTAKITFMDGSEFNIEENTFIVISNENNSPNLSLQKGFLSAKSKGQFSIKVGKNHVVNFNEGESEVDFKVDKNNKVNIDVFKGKSTVESDSESYELNSSQSVSIAKDNTKEITTVPLKLLIPANESTIPVKKLGNLKFLWKKHSKSTQYVIAIYFEEEEEPVLEKQLNKVNIFHKLEKFGNYFWKVTALDKQRKVIAEGGPFSFELVQNVPPKLLSPQIEDVIFPKTGTKYSSISFTWKDLKNQFGTYEFKISKDDEFKQLIFKKKIDDNTLIIDLNDGTYFWKVRRIEGDWGSSDWSEFKKFSFIGRIGGLNLIFPGSNATLETTGNTKEENVKFEWKDKKSKFSSYIIIIASDSQFKTIVAQKDSEEMAIKIPLEKYKNYYWRVDGVLDSGKIIPSVTGRFNLGISEDMIPVILTKDIYFEF